MTVLKGGCGEMERRTKGGKTESDEIRVEKVRSGIEK